MKNDQKIYTFIERLEQNTHTETEKPHSLFKIIERFIFWYSDSMQ